MGLVVHINLAEQILEDFASGMDLSPPTTKQDKEDLEEYNEFLEDLVDIPFIFEGVNYEEV